jgi:hypothetical protein
MKFRQIRTGSTPEWLKHTLQYLPAIFFYDIQLDGYFTTAEGLM